MTTSTLGSRVESHPDHAWLTQMSSAVDRQSIEENLRFLAPDVRFRFGNGEFIVGHAALRQGLAQFYAAIAGLRHDLVGIWRQDDVLAVEAEVTYTRLDGTDVAVPVLSLMRLAGPHLVADHRVFFDLAPVFASPPPVTAPEG